MSTPQYKAVPTSLMRNNAIVERLQRMGEIESVARKTKNLKKNAYQ